MARALLPLAVTLAALSFSARAGAYCRTTTVAIPDGYDPTMEGCITAGTPIFWPSMPVTYELNEGASAQISLVDATSVFEAAFASWTQVSCGAAGATAPPALSFEIEAPTTLAYTHCGADAQACEMAESQGPHQIVFRDDAWPYDDHANTIALTTVTFGLDTGHILSSNMEINSHDFELSIADPPPPGKIALPAIARHEGGHFVGLAHSQDTSAAMYAYYSADMMTLTPDDVAGICAVYSPESASGCSCSAEGGAGGALGLGVAGVALAAVVGRRRRLTGRARSGGRHPSSG